MYLYRCVYVTNAAKTKLESYPDHFMAMIISSVTLAN